MRLQWVLLAEGIGQDSKGAWTAIGINQNIIATDTLPIQTKRAIIAKLVDQGDSSNFYEGSLIVNLSIMSPSDRRISTNTLQVNVGARKVADAPGTGEIPAEFGIPIREYGTYTIIVEVIKEDGSSESMQEHLYAVRSSDIRQS